MGKAKGIGLLVATALAAATAAGAAPDLSGDWRGAVHVPGAQVDFHLTFNRLDGGWTGAVNIPQFQAADLPLGPVQVRGDSVLFSLPSMTGTPRFAGVLSADGAALSGDYAQGGRHTTFALRRAGAPAPALDRLRAFVDTARASWEVPGLALGIVKDGEVVLAEGFGLRDVAGGLPVTDRTLFAIGSTTKAMTCMAIGMLVDEGRMDWDERVRAYLPSFALQDPARAERITLRDLVTHRSGLPRHDGLWHEAALGRGELVHRLRYLQASAELRERFQYNNLMYMVAGYAAGQVTGGTWEQLVAQRLFAPLGMDDSNFSVAQSQRAADHAVPYAGRDGAVRAIPFSPIDAAGPAGSVNSSAGDMVKWLKFHLDGGKVGQRQLISPSALQDMYAPHMPMPSQPDPDGTSLTSYGLGWVVSSYRGHLRLEHGGGVDGFTASVSLLPHDGLGIVVLANRGGSPLPEIVARHVTDLLLGLPPVDWHAQGKMAAANAPEPPRSRPVAGTRPAHPFADYLGDYVHPAYGTVTITLEDGGLAGHYRDFSAPLTHFHYDTFKAVEPDGAEQLLTFFTDATGEVAWLSIPIEPAVDPIEFLHQPQVRHYDVRRATGPIAVDGKLDEPAWARAPYTQDFVAFASGAEAARRTRAQMAWSDTHWYIAWTADDPDVLGQMTGRDDGVWQEDSVELFIDPDGNGHTYAQVAVNPLGTVLDLVMSKEPDAGGFGDVAWSLAGLEVGVGVDGTVGGEQNKDKRWVCELAIPFAALAFAAPGAAFPPAAGDQWRVNLARTDYERRAGSRAAEHTAWSRTDERGYHVPERFGRITFAD